MSPSPPNPRKLTPENWKPEPLEGPPLSVLHIDDDLVVIDKPPNMNVHRDFRGQRGERQILQTLSRQLGQYIWPVHRLDRNTSGAMMFALRQEAARELSEQLAGATKIYFVLGRGEMPGTHFSDRPLKNDAGTPQDARTTFEALAIFSRCTLMRATIETGRRHQIRRHLNHLAHQVIGDSSYGKGRINAFFRETYGLPRMFLHAHRLEFNHPSSGERVAFTVPLAVDLTEFLERLPDVPPEVWPVLRAT